MPLYDFKCRKCGKVVEAILSTSESKRARKLICDKCGAIADRQFPAPNFKVEGYNEKNGYGQS